MIYFYVLFLFLNIRLIFLNKSFQIYVLTGCVKGKQIMDSYYWGNPLEMHLFLLNAQNIHNDFQYYT